jgi:hypothetical protein
MRRGALAVVLWLVCSTSPALARDPSGRYADAPHAEWFRSQHNAKGDWCCDKSDGHAYYGEYTMNDDGSVTVELVGKRHTLPAYMVLTGANPTGHAVWWYVDTNQMGHVDYCFAPGALG